MNEEEENFKEDSHHEGNTRAACLVTDADFAKLEAQLITIDSDVKREAYANEVARRVFNRDLKKMQQQQQQ